MTPEQLATLKAYIFSQPDLASEPMNDDGHFNIAQKMNTQLAQPDFFVWRTLVSIAEIMGNGFDWTRVDNMTEGEARIWELMTDVGTIDPSKANIRAGVNEAFKGTAQDDTLRGIIFQHCQRPATRGQRIFATGAGTSATNTGTGPGLAVIEEVTASDVQQARALP